MSSISSVNSSNSAWSALNTQRSQHQAKLLAKVDTDGSGGVDQTELSTMLSDIKDKTGANLGDSKALFKDMDGNSDGTLSSDELAKGMKALMPPPTTMDFAQTRAKQSSDQGEDLFNKIDSNGDGSVDATEIKALTDKIKSDTGEDASQKFSQLDTNDDGELSKAEFETGRPQVPQGAGAAQGPKGPPPAGGPGGAGGTSGASSTSTTYDELDLNKDGTVSELERLAGALKELATETDGSGSGNMSEIAKLAQKLYDQISNGLLDRADSTSGESQLNTTA